MVDHNMLHRELTRLATASDIDLYHGLHELTLTTAAALEVDGAGVTVSMPTGGTQFITATDAVTLHVERQQDELKQGACIDAIRTSEVVAVNDLTVESRWPDFAPVVLASGFHSVAGVPISLDGQNIGAINLYAHDSRAWTTDEFTAAHLIADLATGYLINRELLRGSQTLAAQLQHALDSRIVIEQAKGVLAGRHGMTPDAAFEILRSHARTNRAKLHDVAAAVVRGTVDMIGEKSGGSSASGARLTDLP